MATEGTAVVVNYISSKESADRVVAEIMDNGDKTISIQGNVANSSDVKRLFEEAKKAFGFIDVLVNNAPVVAFLASDDSAWLTGERISASGGFR
jgi:3-oxoacyl-[acyl-carrier protein] reductase